MCLWVYLTICYFREPDQIKYCKEAIQNCPKSGNIWCELARYINCKIRYYMMPINFDPIKAKKYLEFSIILTPQYGDTYLEYLRLVLIFRYVLLLPYGRERVKLELIRSSINHILLKACNFKPNYGSM